MFQYIFLEKNLNTRLNDSQASINSTDSEEDHQSEGDDEAPEFDWWSHYNLAGWFSKMLFLWVDPIMKYSKFIFWKTLINQLDSMGNNLSVDVLGETPKDEKWSEQVRKLKESWEKHKDKKGNNLLKAITAV